MGSFDIIFLAIALAMDCFAVSIVSGVIMRRTIWRVILSMSVLFGLFQAGMPLMGWFCTSHFSGYIEAVDHWIAFAMLAFIGGRMMRESLNPEEEMHFRPERFCTQLFLAVATSIDALAVGISLACVGYDGLGQLVMPLSVIGVVSFLFGVAGCFLGLRFGRVISRRLRPELVGGIILVFIGIKILLTHIFGL